MFEHLDQMRKAYDKWAPIYDLVYDGLTAPARRSAVSALGVSPVFTVSLGSKSSKVVSTSAQGWW